MASINTTPNIPTQPEAEANGRLFMLLPLRAFWGLLKAGSGDVR